MIEESKYCSDVIKKTWWVKKTMAILRTPLNVGFVILIVLILMFKLEIIFISLEYTEALHREIVISISISRPK